MASMNLFDQASQDLAHKVHKLSTDALKVMLCNVAPVRTNSVKADLTEIAAGNGYTAGGNVAAVVSSAQTGGNYTLVLSDVVFTAAGGSMAAFRYAVLWNDTPTSPADPLLGWWDYGASTVLAAGRSFVVDFAAAGPIQIRPGNQ